MFETEGFGFCEMCDQTVDVFYCEDAECEEQCPNCHSEYGCQI